MKVFLILTLIAVVSANPIEIESDGTFTRKLDKVADPTIYEESWFDEKNFESFILNGTDAYLGQFPHAARVQIRFGSLASFCSGSFIRENFALTASHCLSDPTITSLALWGGIVDRTQPGGVTLEVAQFWWHPQEVTTLGHDIALMRTFSNLPAGNPHIGYIRIPSRAQTNWPFHGPVRLIGWGRDNTGSNALWLQYADFVNVPLSQCTDRFIEPVELCYIDPENWRMSQPGDSGAPVIIIENGIPLQVGIHAGRRTTGGRTFQSAARISAFLPWLEERGVRIRDN